jgi:hypothetical protein
VTPSAAWGTGGQYVTRKRPGLWVMAADPKAVSLFEITGNLGADGGGITSAAELTRTVGGVTWKGFVKRVSGAGDPSVNHLILVPSTTATRTYSSDTNSDQHRVSGLETIDRIYYLLFSSSNGSLITDATMGTIMDKFLEIVGSGSGAVPRWLTLVPDQGTVAPGATADVVATLNATGLNSGVPSPASRPMTGPTRKSTSQLN